MIIDKDKKAVETIKAVCEDFTELSYSVIKENQEVALNTILKKKPEVIFINIDSTEINFLEFLFELSQYSEYQPFFVALSTSKEKAFDSYKYNFSDFLLKPLNELSIRKSLLKYQKKHQFDEIETICLKSYKDYQYLNIEDILYLKADNNTTDFHMANGRIIRAYKTLKIFENLLPQTFLRIHKSYIINIHCISRIHYGKSVCIINNEHKIPFTKTFITNIDLINQVLLKNTMLTLN
ncbi:LytR/AlgR family response regulator transcription factor [Aquimarina intermedia]|uniref:LytR/AlgR family response regulator transcription factor n=1 Tax=Aquimarina intermedia TaxID=350814 RepID=UPI0014792C4F|nr:LytTR family DNA-binding domain-containing protein [Aquimarina intermedia]